MRTTACFAVIAASIGILAAACDDLEGKSCTEVACNQGIDVSFQYREAGTYAVEVTVDGEKTTCTATLPLGTEPDANDPCAAKGIYLTRSGSKLPASEQSVGGLHITSVTVKSLQVRVTRDGDVLGEATYTPEYVVTPGPNGPDCEPKECRFVSYDLTLVPR
ncbi:MAG TPA: hypothetical protein VM925_24225 [Labilithrix sp.]|jgi:hypothetical protein|nr:hypothetical protein [Labilithrix sp.]